MHQKRGFILLIAGSLSFYQCFSQPIAADILPTVESLSKKSAQLHKSVATLKKNSFSEIFKASILHIALERIDSSLQLGIVKNMPELLEDVEKSIPQKSDYFAENNTASPNLSVLRKPFKTINNPYIDFAAEGFKEYIQCNNGMDFSFGVNRLSPRKYIFDETQNMFTPRPYNVRHVAATAETLFWLFSNPYSPFFTQDKPNAYTEELLLRWLRRMHAYTDAMYVFGNVVKGQKEYLDDFAINAFSTVLRESITLYPHFLLPTQRKIWFEAIHTNAEELFRQSENMYGLYPNIDIVRGYELLNFGLLLNNEAYLKKADFLLHAVEKFIYPDGAVGYIGAQNEVPGYQSSVIRDLANYYRITQNPIIPDMIKRCQWYGPTIGVTPEFYTCPAWKHMWNDVEGIDIGGEPVVFFSKNPYLRAMQGLPKTVDDKRNRYKGWFNHLWNIEWYRDDIPAKRLPDSFTVADRNINGVRAQYGRFVYAATLRHIPTNPPVDVKRPDPGHSTLIGGLIYNGADSSLKSAIMGATIRLKMHNKPDSEKAAWAWQTSNMKSSQTIGRHFSAIQATYQLHQWGSSKKGTDIDAQGKQMWLQLPDRIIGQVSVKSLSDALKTYAINGVINLGYGGSAKGKEITLKKIDDHHYEYDEYLITLHHHTFSKFNWVMNKFRNANNTELVWLDSLSSNGSSITPYSVAKNTEYNYLVEIKPTWNKTTDAKIEELTLDNGLTGFRFSFDKSLITIVINNSNNIADYVIDWKLPKHITKSIHQSKSNTLINTAFPTSLQIPSNEHIVLIESNNANLHQPSWKNYQEMILEKENMKKK